MKFALALNNLLKVQPKPRLLHGKVNT